MINELEKNVIHLGDNIDVLKTFPDNSIDSVVTDPPYGISFMNKKWDYDVPTVDLWKEVYRVLKHGGYMLVACGTRTQHRMAVNIEDAGFEIRDIVGWVYGSGFPKSKNISLSIDKKFGLQGHRGKAINVAGKGERKDSSTTFDVLEPYTNAKSEEAKKWQGWGSALKPSMELWTLARKPIKGTVAQNIMQYGTGGLNIDGCRVETDDDLSANYNSIRKSDDVMGERGYKMGFRQGKDSIAYATESTKLGRFPTNLIHDNSEEVKSAFPDTSSDDDSGSASRFFKSCEYSEEDILFDTALRIYYTSKASQTERNWGLGGFEDNIVTDGRQKPIDNAFYRGETIRKNIHPTVKPVELMKYLVRLITPKGGVCLDPYMGSGTTAVACKAEKFDCIGIEIDKEYHKIAEARVKAENVVYNIFDFLEEEGKNEKTD